MIDMLDLGHAYRTTDEPRLDTWQRLVGVWATDVPADVGPTETIDAFPSGQRAVA